MNTPFRRHVALAAALLTLVSCSVEPPTSPPPSVAPAAAPSADLLGAVTGGLLNTVGSLLSMDGLRRTTPLAAPLTVTATIGSAGGTIAIPEAGVSVLVPQGALDKPTVITMTARSGELVAYDFAPHGITFAKPLTFTQQLRGTNASLLTAPLLSLGYYKDASLLTKTGGLISELLGGVVNLTSWTFTGKIPHFSGYIVTCGRRGE
jgi:hypothetical protein